MSDSQPLRLVVDSTPDDRELAAIAAAVMALSSAQQEPASAIPLNPWREANKRESMRTAIKEDRS